MRLLDLFSGIGGFSLGLERAGFRTVAFCEIEPYPRAVLAKHWPGVPIYDDVRTLSADTLRRDGISVDAICGGFPCQDLSFAGKRAGIEGERSGLWSEYARLIGEIRPRVAIMENVPGLLSAGHGRVLGDLAALGYNAVWDCIPASALSAPHRRDRVWIVAYAQSERRGERGRDSQRPTERIASGGEVLADAKINERGGRLRKTGTKQNGFESADGCEVVADANAARAQTNGISSRVHSQHNRAGGGGQTFSNPIGRGRPGQGLHEDAGNSTASSSRQATEPVDGGRPRQWGAQCRLDRVVDGLPDWVDASAWLQEPENVPRVVKGQENRAHRLKGLGNAVVPQVVEAIGRAVMEGLSAA